MSQLLINPKLRTEEREIFEKLQKHFEKKFGAEGFYFVPSSGSSKHEGESAKLIALSQTAVANSAERFNKYFQAEKEDSWGLVLPTFHVAGLSVLARANLLGARVFSSDWIPAKIEQWLLQNRIAFLSLVPTQVYDLVQQRTSSTPFIKKVFVGGGALNPALREKFVNLGWPVVETYGMTETCSMIAVKEGVSGFKVLPGVEVYIENQMLRIHCNSSAHSSIQFKQGQIEIIEFDSGWIHTEDQVQIDKHGEDLYLHFIGRASDYVKIVGEGVSLPELREKLDQVSVEFGLTPQQKYLLAVPDMRSENAIVLVIDTSIERKLADRLVEKFNQVVRGYERIHKIIKVDQIPFSDLGKVRVGELKDIVIKEMQAGMK